MTAEATSDKEPQEGPYREEGGEPLIRCRGVAKDLRARRREAARPRQPRPRRPRGLVRSAHGPVGLGQVDAPQPDRRASTGRRRARIEIGGKRIDQMSEGELAKWRANTIGFIFQCYNLLPVLTAVENVELPLLLTPVASPRAAQARRDGAARRRARGPR